MKKYELTDETIEHEGRTLYRIRALKSFAQSFEGNLGGYIESEDNLSHQGDAWIYGDAKVFDNARILGNATVFDDAQVCGEAKIYDEAKVFGSAKVMDSACVFGHALVTNDAVIGGNTHIYGDTWVFANGQTPESYRMRGTPQRSTLTDKE